MATLYEITDDMKALAELLGEVDGDISDPRVAQAVEEWFAETDRDFRRKADGYAAFIVELEARAKARKEEADRLATRAKVDRATADFLRERLKRTMQELGIKSVETDRFKVGVQGNGGMQPLELDVADARQLPEWAQAIEVSANREEIRARLDAGEALPFARLLPRGTRLSIR